jgi:hypothetical protein
VNLQRPFNGPTLTTLPTLPAEAQLRAQLGDTDGLFITHSICIATCLYVLFLPLFYL